MQGDAVKHAGKTIQVQGKSHSDITNVQFGLTSSTHTHTYTGSLKKKPNVYLFIILVKKSLTLSSVQMFFGQDCWCRCCRHTAIFLSVTNNNNTGQNASSFSHLVYNRNGSPVTLPSRQCLCARWQTKLYSDSEVYKELLILYPLHCAININFTMRQ